MIAVSPSLPCVFLQQQGNQATDAVAAVVHIHNTNDSISQPDMTVTAFNGLLRYLVSAQTKESHIMQFALPRMSKAFLFLLVFSAVSVVHAAGSKVPASIAGLLPNSAKLFGSDWAVMNTEFGKSFSGGMNAKFSGQPLTCDLTVGPELRMTIKGDTAWEEPPMLDMAIEIFTSEIKQTRASLPGSVKTMLKTNNGVMSVGGLQDEKTPLGQLLYIEFKESCNRHNGAATVLRGFSRKGATMMFFSLMQTKSAAETRAMAMEMMAKFQKLDTAALAK